MSKEATESRLFVDGYQQSQCQYEYALSKSYEKTGCIPWDYIHIEENTPICTRNLVTYFKGNFTHYLGEASNNCLRDCLKIEYPTSIDSSKIDVHLECEQNDIQKLANPVESLSQVDAFAYKVKMTSQKTSKTSYTCKIV